VINENQKTATQAAKGAHLLRDSLKQSEAP